VGKKKERINGKLRAMPSRSVAERDSFLIRKKKNGTDTGLGRGDENRNLTTGGGRGQKRKPLATQVIKKISRTPTRKENQGKRSGGLGPEKVTIAQEAYGRP